MKILLIGYYGRNNLGDDLMLENLVFMIKKIKPDCKISVALHNINTMPGQLENTIRIDTSDKVKYIKNIISSDIVVWGGGTCFYDAGETKITRGLNDLIKIAIVCKLFNTKLIFLGVGIGKVTDRIKNKIKTIFNYSHSLYFRDEESFSEGHNYTKKKLYRSGDLALLGNIEKFSSNEKKYVTYSGVYNYAINTQHLAWLLDDLSRETNTEIAFLPCHRAPHDDNEHHQNVANLLNVKYTIFDTNTIDEYLQILSCSQFHIGVRLHSIVLSDMLAIPNVGIEYSPKIKKYIKSTNVLFEDRSNPRVEDISINKIKNIIKNYVRPTEYINGENKLSLIAIERVINDLGI